MTAATAFPAILLLGLALLLVVMAVPLILGRVKRNRWYGFRTSATLASDEIWYPANKSMGWGLLWNGVILALLVGFVLLRVPGFSLLLVILYLPLASAITVAIGFHKISRLR